MGDFNVLVGSEEQIGWPEQEICNSICIVHSGEVEAAWSSG